MADTKGRTAFVTGGHGFLGSHLVDLLLEKGLAVRCLLRPGRGSGVFGQKRVQVARGDLRLEQGLEQAVRGADYVFHVAGLIAARGPRHFHAVNAAGTRRLARAVRSAAPGCRRFVYVSSQAAAGPSPDGRPIDEDRCPQPVSHYGRSKLAGERALAAEGDGLAFTVVRPPAIYGPRDEAILPFFRMAQRGVAPGLEGPGRRFDLLHARDVAEGLWAAATTSCAAGRTYFLAGKTGYSYPELAAALGRVFGRKPRRIPMPDLLLDLVAVATDELAALTGGVSVFGRQKAIEFKARWWLCSPRRAERDLGWRARIPLAEGLKSTACWYEEAGRLPRRRGTSL